MLAHQGLVVAGEYFWCITTSGQKVAITADRQKKVEEEMLWWYCCVVVVAVLPFTFGPHFR